MPRYQVGGMVLDSNISFPSLQDQPCLKFQLCHSPPPPLPVFNWSHRFGEDGAVWLSIGKTAAHYVWRFPRDAEFHLELRPQKIICYPAPNSAPDTIHHLLLDQVLPMILSHAGSIVLHAGAVVTPAGAIAFLGASGAGKSTLTSYFAQQGGSVLTDDFLRLDLQQQIWGFPSYSGVRLFSHHLQNLFADAQTKSVAAQSEKRRLLLSENALSFHPYPAPVRRMFLLEAAPEIKILPIAPQDKFMTLVKNSFHLDLQDWHLWRTKMVMLTRIAEANLLFRLQYPRELMALPLVRDAILQELNI